MQPTRVIASAVAAAVAGIGAATAVASPALADADTGNVAGAVRDTKGTIVTDARINVYAEDGFDPVAQTTTDAAGRFRVADLEAGRYKIQIGLGGWSEWAPGRRAESDAAVYRIVAGRTTVANSVVTAPGVITGRLLAATGGPAANVGVTADDYDTARSWNTTTAADGTYALRVPPGTNYVVTFRDGYFRQYAPHTVDQAQARHYTVRSGRTLRVDDRLLVAPSLTGRLVDAAGAPVADARVRFLSDTAFELTTTTDADGRYRFDKLAAGTVRVSFRTTDNRVQWAYQALSYNDAAEIALPVGAVVTVDDQLRSDLVPEVPETN